MRYYKKITCEKSEFYRKNKRSHKNVFQDEVSKSDCVMRGT